MRIVKLMAALVAAFAICAIGVATASAAETLWRWLPGSAKETFKGASDTGNVPILEISEKAGTFKCSKGTTILLTDSELKVSSELLEKEAKLALAILHLTGCESGGLAMKSKGDASGTILAHFELHNCVISTSPLVFGLLVLLLPITVEFPAVEKLTIAVSGSFVAPISKVAANDYTLNAEQTSWVQSVKKCEGGTEETLLVSINGGANKKAGVGTKLLLEFDKTIDKEEELMV
jgi:hypothetical protein